jgi:hypothetical protein
VANVAAGIRSSAERSGDAKRIFDEATPLCARLRYARLRAGQPEWWVKQFQSIASKFDRHLIVLAAITWCSQAALPRLLPIIEQEVSKLGDAEFRRLFVALRRSLDSPTRPWASTSVIDAYPLAPRMAALLFERTRSEELFVRVIATYDGSEAHLVDMQQEWAIEMLAFRRDDWRGALEVVSKAYKRGGLSRRFAYPTFTHHRNIAMPADVARAVVHDAELYPGYVVAMAQEVCRAIVAEAIVPVGQVAERDKWFG